MPAISVILPTFNRTALLRESVESVFAQTCSDWELVIADDGSNEATRAYLRTLPTSRVRTLLLEHCGNPSGVRNAALAVARGEFVAFLDSDDSWMPTKLERQLAAMRAAGAPDGWCYCLYEHMDRSGNRVVPRRPPPQHFPDGPVFEPLLKLDFAIPMPVVFAARALVDAAGRFDEQQRFGEFHDLCLRLALRSPVTALRENLCRIRTHDEHYSSDRIGAQTGWMRLYEKMATLAPTPRLRTHCRRMQGSTALSLAWLQGNSGDSAAVRSTLREAVRFSWTSPRWWYGAVKAAIRPHVLSKR
jgi:glycosyltransferase involved in cell wall biosynthesis